MNGIILWAAFGMGKQYQCANLAIPVRTNKICPSFAAIIIMSLKPAKTTSSVSFSYYAYDPAMIARDHDLRRFVLSYTFSILHTHTCIV